MCAIYPQCDNSTCPTEDVNSEWIILGYDTTAVKGYLELFTVIQVHNKRHLTYMETLNSDHLSELIAKRPHIIYTAVRKSDIWWNI